MLNELVSKLPFWTCLFLFVANLQAQNADDALRYSLTGFGGTARSMGVGGAFSSLGADLSVIGTNPAGLAFYRKSELSITPSLYFSDTETTYLGELTVDNRNRFNLNQLGFVSAKVARKNGDKERDWRSTAFAIGFNRLANYNRQFSLRGYNQQSSITDYYASQAQGIAEGNLLDAEPYYLGPAYWSYLINPDSTGQNYAGTAAGGNIQQEQYMLEKGAMDELSIAMGGNYQDKLHIGAGIGVPFVRYSRETTYSEEDINNVIPDFVKFNQSEILDASGIGINAKLGLIYRPLEWVRVGIAAHTPTLLSLNENFHTQMQADFESFQPDQQVSPDGKFEYRLKTPWRLVTGASFIVKKAGFVSVDYEWADYSQNEVETDGNDDFRLELNADIRQRFKPVHTIRIGGEAAYKIFRARLGYALQTSPYAVETASGFGRQSITGGVGIRDDGIFADLAFVHHASKNEYVLYTDSPTASLKQGNNNLVFTIGFRW